jgi:hypothetical protein
LQQRLQQSAFMSGIDSVMLWLLQSLILTHKIASAPPHHLLTKTTGNFPSKIYVTATGHHHCTATYIDVFRNPQDVSQAALDHIGAELSATAILYPNLMD